LTGKEVQQVLSRVSNLTSHQIADKILATDLAVALDSVGYFDRRLSWGIKRGGSSSNQSGSSTGGTRDS
jgi:hypothetical protein